MQSDDMIMLQYDSLYFRFAQKYINEAQSASTSLSVKYDIDGMTVLTVITSTKSIRIRHQLNNYTTPIV